MEVMMKITLVFLILASAPVLATAASDKPADLVIDESSVFKLRDSLKLLTPEPHLVSEALAELCIVPTPKDAQSSQAREAHRVGRHANVAVNYYVSFEGAPAMDSMKHKFPVGTILLKEKLSLSDGTVAAVGGMVKRAEGFDSTNGNWAYFYAAKTGGFEIGRIPNCVSCHARTRSSDYVYSRTKGTR